MMAQPSLEPTTEEPTHPSKEVSWYTKDVTAIGEPARHHLESYSGISPSEVVSHVLAIRDRAWPVVPYPCIGQLRFLDLSITVHPFYTEVIRLLSSNHQNLFLDLGCCFGQDIRPLVTAGISSTQLYGADLEETFIELGYELFKDKETLQSKFILENIFDEAAWGQDGGFGSLEGKLKVIHTASFFHLFDLSEQEHLAKLLIRLLISEPGSMILGRHSANEEPGEYPGRGKPNTNCYRHNEETWKAMWEGVGRETGTEWKVEVWKEKDEGFARQPSQRGERGGEGWFRLTFAVTRTR